MAVSDLLNMVQLDAAAVKKASQVISRQVRHNGAAGAYPGHKIAPGAAYVNGDEKRLIQIIANLLNNAAKYTPAGGSISVELGTRDSNVCVEVVDNGLGIAPELQSQIFGLFEQVQRTPDRTQGGVGIGLSLVRNLIDLHGGTIECQSAGVGQGSRFTACVPKLTSDGEASPGAHIDRTIPGPSALRSLSILVVDDNFDAAEMIQVFLKASGHTVRIAHTAKQALELVKSAHPEVCILDIGLPDVTGNELALAIRAMTSDVQILIALTGYGTARGQERALQSGFDHYFVKPADPEALVSVLVRLTGGQV